MFGGDGNDAMYGDNGDYDDIGDDDHMYGGAGDDFMLGGGGNDAMYGGADDDDMDGWTGDDVMYGGEGEDFMLGWTGNDTMSGGAGNDEMLGEQNDDVMDGGAGDDWMYGGSGNDHMSGGEGADLMYGDDMMYGGPVAQLYGGGLYGYGNDTMLGGEGADIMYGDGGDNSPFGGDDVMYGGAGTDDMFGEGGDDAMFGDEGRDYMDGGFGNDAMSGGDGDDSMAGGFGNDVLRGDDGWDQMEGNAGDDVMFGDAGNDEMDGGSGDDIMSGGEGSDDMYGGSGHDSMDGGRRDDLMYGGSGDDTMEGGLGDDQMYGGSGDDDMLGGRGRDTLDGESGSDDVNGGRGADTLQWTYGENAGATDNYDGGLHTDTLELYFTTVEFAAHEEAIAKFANDVEDTGTGSLVIGGRTLNADNIEFVAVHVDGAEVPVLIDDTITTNEDASITEQITADPNTQDFIPNAQTTTFNTPSAVVLTTPLGGGTVVNFAQGDWVQAGDVWTLDLVDGSDNYGQLIVDATDPEAVTATLDIPDAANSAWEPMDTGDNATVVFDYSATVEGSESATVTINVEGVNDAPVAVDDIVITNTLDPIDVPHSALMANDSDIDEDEVLDITEVTPDAFIDGDFVTVPGSNRIDNPSFEEQGDDVNVNHGSWATYNSLPGWFVDTGAANAPIELQFGGTGGIGAQDGNAKMEMDSHNEGGYTQSNAHVYQDVPTSAGEELTLSFWYSPRTASSNGVRVVWNGVEVAVLDGDVPGWQEFTFEVEGVDGTSRLEFQGLPSENTLGGYIDNVYVGERDFDYTLSDGDETDDAHVDVQYQVGNQLVGGDENEILISGDEADTLSGGAGDDTLIGGEGDDVLIGGEGEDEHFFSDAATDGDDTILGFEEGDDTINLDALFDELGIADVDRAADVTLDNSSGSTVITVDGQSDFSITVSDVDLGNGNFTSEELAAKGIIVSDES